MSSITIAYGASGIRGTIASKVADELGYELIGRSVLQAASQTYNIEESKLAYVIHHGPSFFGISETTRNRYLACVLAASAGFLLKDNVVFNGPAGFLIAQGVSHILKVRMVPTLEDRIAFIMERDNLSHEKAEHTVSRDEKDRKKWSSKVFGIDDSDTNHYDLNIEFDRTNEERIIERIVSASRDKRYQPMTYSWRCIGNKELTYRIRAVLYDLDPELRVRCENGNVFINSKASGRTKDKNAEAIEQRLDAMPDVKQVEIQMDDDMFDRSAGFMR